MKGIAASKGYAIAEVFLLEYPDLSVNDDKIDNVEAEIVLLNEAVANTKVMLDKIFSITLNKLGQEKANVFKAHLLMLNDPELLNTTINKVKTTKVNAKFALKETADDFIAIFSSIDDEYMRERAADVRDVTTRLLATLMGKQLPDLSIIDKEVIIVADDLTPSETALLDPKFVRGFATNKGGYTSHTSIIARSLQIPAVVGLTDITTLVTNDVLMAINGIDGLIIIDPSTENKAEYADLEQAFLEERKLLLKFKDLQSQTKDGRHIEIAANIASPNDLGPVIDNNADGIGLFRSEFLYMDSDKEPTEDEQFVVYKEVLSRMDNRPVVIRTIDIGGDKELPYLKLEHEDNPFLGYRAIRFCIDTMQDLFKTQLRALLKASPFGNLKIMFPMIATIEEFRQAKAIYNIARDELLSEGVEISENVEIGVMIEVPAAALNAESLAKEVDFFSVGTNDLVAYTFAADRMNEKVSYLYQPYHPSIIRLLKIVIDASHKEGKWTGMCGEMAGDLMAIPLLVGLGLDEFSMSASAILEAKKLIYDLDTNDMKILVEEALDCATNDEVIKLLKEAIKG